MNFKEWLELERVQVPANKKTHEEKKDDLIARLWQERHELMDRVHAMEITISNLRRKEMMQ